MKMQNIITTAILSEKAYRGIEKGIYVFLVNSKATKKDISGIIEKQFSVNVEKVNITPLYPKRKRVGKTRKFTTVSKPGKKATVWLKAGQKIEILSPKAEKETKKKSNSEKDVQKVKVEGKEG